MITVNLSEIEMMTVLNALNTHSSVLENDIDKNICTRLDKKLRDEISKYFKIKDKK